MKLYGYYRSSTSYRVRIALNLKQLRYDYIPVNLKAGEQRQQPFAEISAYQTVPALETGDQILTQSLAILDWLDRHHPEPAFVPDDDTAAHSCRELYYAVASEVHAPNNLTVLKYLKTNFGADQAALETWNQTWIARTFAAIERRLGDIHWLSDSLPFGKPSLFEIVLIPQIYNARRWKTDLSPYPQLTRIDDYCLTLEAFKLAHPDRQPDAV